MFNALAEYSIVYVELKCIVSEINVCWQHHRQQQWRWRVVDKIKSL